MTHLIKHPLDYKEQIQTAIKSNSLNEEVVWTYLIARKYENDVNALAKLLCREDLNSGQSKIWLEAYLQPTRRNEGRSWKTRADLAIGYFEKEVGVKHRIRSSGGDWICVVESKWYEDLSFSEANKTNQLLRIIEHSVISHNNEGTFPDKVYVSLVTPKYFKEASGRFSNREYANIYEEYSNRESKRLDSDLALCPLPFLKHNLEVLTERIESLVLNWITFEELLGLPNLVESHVPGLYRVTFDSWQNVFRKMGRTDLIEELL